jgi:hypothetical protein
MRAMERAVRIGLVVGLVLAGCDEGATTSDGAMAGAATSAGGQVSVAGGAGTVSLSGAGTSGVGTSAGGAGSTLAGAGGGASVSGATTGGASVSGSGGAAGTASGGASESGGGAAAQNKVFSQCRMHFGTIDSKAKDSPAMIPELDFFTPGWMGLADTFDQKYVCDEGKEGAMLGKQVPVIVAYVSAFYVKRHHGTLCDCNVNECGQTNGKPNDLCNFGAQYIQQDLAAITDVYKSYAQGFASCYGTTRPIVFEMEPDFYQYTGSSQGMPMTKAQAGMILGQYVSTIKQYLPNAYFSIDISPWVDDNGASNGKDWYSHFDLSKFTFVNTSGGSTLGANTKIRSDNMMTWSGVSQVTGKGVLADTGYGANGISAGHDANWDDVNDLNARIGDGVVSISQYNPKPDWAATIAAVRSQLKTPKFCP